ncbi:MAG: hypothetical protein QOH46_1103 [Solirubrobacteraceae bacterium]|jgi:hypothetical protein|nr:hypothetical protein [Solirubrobacteraceae bacterium]
MSGLVAEFVRRYAERRVPGASTVVDLWPSGGSPLRHLASGAGAWPDLVVGVAPWGAQPIEATLAGRVLPLRDEAAHVRLLKACAGLAPDGAGLFVLSMGFVASRRRGGVCASLGEFGLHIEALLGLPRGLLYPDSGPGRLLVCIRPGPSRAPVVARLTRDPASIDEPLSRMA